jgi:hypothetical protein
VARQRKPQDRKLRTRQHIIADLSVNYVERHILLRGFSANRLVTDYGLDLSMTTHSDNGEVENGFVLFQVKATDDLQILKDGKSFAFRVEIADLKAWQAEFLPVILVIYDGQKDRAFWIFVQLYLNEKNVTMDDLTPDQDRVTLRIPLAQRLNRGAVEQFRRFRNQFLSRLKGRPYGQ